MRTDDFCDVCVTTRWCEWKGRCLAECLPPPPKDAAESPAPQAWQPIDTAPNSFGNIDEAQREVRRLEGICRKYYDSLTQIRDAISAIVGPQEGTK